MADAAHIQLRGFDRLIEALGQAPDIVAQEMNTFMAWAVPLLQSEVVDRTPTAAGSLRQSIIGTWTVSATGMVGVVGTPLNYAPAVELGTKPHPVSHEGILALAEWAKRKLPLGQRVSAKTGKPLKTPGLDEAAMAAAKAIAWKILHRGTQGAHMFEEAFKANVARVQGRFDDTLARIVQRIGGGA